MAFNRIPLNITRLFEIHLNTSYVLAHSLDGINPQYATKAIIENAAATQIGVPGSYSLNQIQDVSISSTPEGRILCYSNGYWVDSAAASLTDVKVISTSIVSGSSGSRVATFPNSTTSTIGLMKQAAYTDTASTALLATPAGLQYQLTKTVLHRLGVVTNLAEGTWYLDSASSTLYQSGTSINVASGSHTINFSSVSGYSTPSSQSATIADSSTNAKVCVVGTYTPTTGKVMVLMNQSSGKWSPNSGSTWYNANTEVELSAGTYTFTFSTVSSVTPSSISVTITANTSRQIVVFY